MFCSVIQLFVGGFPSNFAQIFLMMEKFVMALLKVIHIPFISRSLWTNKWKKLQTNNKIDISALL